MMYTRAFIDSLSDKYAEVRFAAADSLLEAYTKALEADAMVPVFSKTAKYKSFPKKHIKTTRRGGNLIIKGGAARHRLFTPNSDIDRIKQAIRGTLNKINDRNFGAVVEELEREIVKFNSVETLDILAEEVHKKIMHDVKYQSVYITLCQRIWALCDWQDSLVTIVNGPEVVKEGSCNLFWIKNQGIAQEDTTLYGPFKDEAALREASRNVVNFRRVLMDLLRSEFMKREGYLTKYYEIKDENVQYKMKRSILCVVEFITKLFAVGQMDARVIQSVFNDLLAGDKPDALYIEAFIAGWKGMGESCSAEFKSIFVPVIVRILGDGTGWPNRMKFMMEDWLKAVGVASPGARTVANTTSGTGAATSPLLPPAANAAFGAAAVPAEGVIAPGQDIKDVVSGYFKDGNLVVATEKLRGCDRQKLARTVLDAILDEPGKRMVIGVELVKQVGTETSVLQEVLDEFMGNIDDIIIDNPNAEKTLVAFKNLCV